HGCVHHQELAMTTGLTARVASAAPSPSFFAQASLAILLLLGSLCSTARAADANELQQIVVSATRVPTPAQEVASSITVITAEDIEARQQRTIATMLKNVPGLNVVQTGGPGGVTSVFIRGTNSNHTKVLVDGMDISDPSSPTGSF